jgi:hypothetical protein
MMILVCEKAAGSAYASPLVALFIFAQGKGDYVLILSSLSLSARTLRALQHTRSSADLHRRRAAMKIHYTRERELHVLL